MRSKAPGLDYQSENSDGRLDWGSQGRLDHADATITPTSNQRACIESRQMIAGELDLFGGYLWMQRQCEGNHALTKR
jgi:hypothetical protein